MEKVDNIFLDGVIDKQVFDRLIVFDDPGFLKEMVQVFTEHSLSYLNQLEHASLEKDFLEIRRILHKMQSSCATVGASKMIASILRVRALAKAEEEKNLEKFILLLKQDYFETVKGLQVLVSIPK